ncbi:c-type cytochrome [Thiomicrorhabdus sp.]|uniref:c-type cytochrome n=1 Tax=Thiomicrorhabdus sp. TaxID=2039724 RepID=UPI002AA849FC|nr:c-type cytochrome [Thiomicrorhabdus sp.]
MLKQTLLAATLVGATLASSAALSAGHGEKPHTTPWSNFSLEEKVKTMPQGDATRGQQIHEQMMCNSCHGVKGESPSRNYASLNGQTKEYTMKMMLDYRDGRRWESYKQANIMVKLARAMDDQQIADAAAFYASNPSTVWQIEAQPVSAKIDHLVRKGDVSRMITPCASCHGAHGEGKGITPAIAGQVPEYFIRTMKAYQGKDRHNDVNQGMAQFTHDLTDEEIRELADYYATLSK